MGREIRRVALDFDWPLDKVWKGFLMPESLHEKTCTDCDGSGYSPEARNLRDRWYGYVPFDPAETGSVPFTPETPEVRAFAERQIERTPEYYGTGERAVLRECLRICKLWNAQWSHHLAQEDVDALIAGDRLWSLTHDFDPETRWTPKDPMPEITADQVNRWSLEGFGHDSINCHVVIEARCERNGLEKTCKTCKGHGSVEAYEGQREEAENWESTDPPAGEGWQVWETTSEGSPISPVFPDREGVIQWLMSPAYNRGMSRSLTRKQAENFVGNGWAPSFFIDINGVHPGEQM